MKKIKKQKLEGQVIGFLKDHPNRVYKSRELAKQLGISNRDYQSFKRLIRDLEGEGKIVRRKGNRYGQFNKLSVVTGVLNIKSQGFGFIKRNGDREDIFISRRNMGSALDGDHVNVSLLGRSKGKLPEGRVIEIREREQISAKRIVGTFYLSGAYGYVVPNDLKINGDIRIPQEGRLHAENGQKVVVEIDSRKTDRRLSQGKIIEVLGRPDEKGVDVLSIIHAFDLPVRFPNSVLQESEKLCLPSSASDAEKRLDLRDRLTFTIDPEDAKDFDDAISLEILSDGNFQLGVHIADVSAFVEIGSAIDREALRRGTSVYLVDRVISMLPEKLSNNLCSLKPGEDRLTYSVLMILSREGLLRSYEITESKIRSRYRLTYKEVQKIIEGKNRKYQNTDIQLAIKNMFELSQKLKERWRQSGSIDFNAPEPSVTLNENGVPIRLGVREHLESHQLVEAFMLLANRTVAEHISRLRQEEKKKYPFVYRIHEKPSGKKLDEFVRFVRAMGYAFDLGKRIGPKAFQTLIHQVRGTPHEYVVEEIALRTMMKALYSTQNKGHFGLAFKQYTHFTSPIRRYPDLIVHRLLKAYQDGKRESIQLPVKLSEICNISTEREIIAQQVERESIKSKQMRFMEERIGEEYNGIISGVTAFGFFVEIPQYLVEGLVHVRDLGEDYYTYDEMQYLLRGENQGRIFRIGDSVRVRVMRVLRDMRRLDFELMV